MDTCLEGILTETESFVDRQWRDMQFCYEIAEQHREMERFVNECLIKASGNKKAINEMYIIQESAFGDKIKGFFTKIKNFFKKIFDKVGAAMNGLFMEQKKYMDQYSNIITTCKYVATDVEDLKDHFKGIPRMLDAIEDCDAAVLGKNIDKYMDPNTVLGGENKEIRTSEVYPYDDGEKIRQVQIPEKIKLEDVQEKAYNDFISNDYWSKMADLKKENNDNNTVDIKTTFKNYFDGSVDTITYTTDEIDKNFQTVINISYAGPSYLKKLEKIVSSVDKKMDEISKKMEDYYNQQSKKIQDGIKNLNTNDANNKVKQSNGKFDDAWSAATESNGKKTINGKEYTADEAGKKQAENDTKNFYDESYTYFEEIGATNNTNNDANKSKISSKTGANDVENANNAKKSVDDKQLGKTPEAQDSATKNVDAGNKDATLSKANQLLDVDIWNRQARINADVQISSTIANAIFGAFQLTNKDFWWIIQKHVQWYLSNPGKEKDNEYKSSLSKSLNMNAGTEKVNIKQAESENT